MAKAKRSVGRPKMIQDPKDYHFSLPFPTDENGNYLIIPPKRGYSGVTAVNKRKRPDGYIYFIKSKFDDHYKIGVSSNPLRRLQDIDSNLPFDIEILSLHYIIGVYDVEAALTKKLSAYNVRREWYVMPKDKARWVMIYLHNLNLEQDGRN